MLNGEARSSAMIYGALLVEEPFFAGIHPDRDWGKLTRFDLLDFSELLAYFKIRRKVLLRALSGLKEKDWGRVVREEGKQRKESVYWRAPGARDARFRSSGRSGKEALENKITRWFRYVPQ